MIGFFSKIHKHLNDNARPVSYFRYAIGEVFLIVVGILIALQVNNWNEERKRRNLKENYRKALLKDLEKDINQLTQVIETTNQDLEYCQNIGRKISKGVLEVDSIKKIYRKEFPFFIIVDRNFNRNTLEALLSSGHIDLFEDLLHEDLMNFNRLQKEVISAIETELGFYMNYLTLSGLPQTDEQSLIQGEYLDQIWRSIDREEFLKSFNSVLNSKAIVNRITLEKRKILLRETISLRNQLSDAP